MNNADFIQNVEEFFGSIVELIKKKNADYSAGTSDSLYNYYTVAERTGISPLQAWGVLFEKHVAAVEKFIKTGHVESEPIEGRLQDVAAYCALCFCLNKELKQKAEELREVAQEK